MELPPGKLKAILSRDQHRLYTLIWNRFVASQMAPAEFEQTTIDILCDPSGGPAEGYLFRATGSVPRFPGYLEVYQDGGDGNGRRGGTGGAGDEMPGRREGEASVRREGETRKRRRGMAIFFLRSRKANG
jgi:DNA topoisomerase IA